MTTQRIIVGISGASGAIYGIAMLKALAELEVETHLVVSKAAQITIAHETPYSLPQVHAMASHWYAVSDISAPIASGSFKSSGMIIAPCSMRCLGEIATGTTSSLLTRAADVALKERRRLVLMARETPLTTAHLRNMLSVTEMGGIIAPPVPAFYTNPSSLDDIIQHSIGRVLDLFDFDSSSVKRWQGVKPVKA